ncbi:hypothetical protein F4811DRAFT_51732 [Daldinia bambusicola]|nr:hypothetical protein F4811DRAFT_51732 [Daldinia bambusicola]
MSHQGDSNTNPTTNPNANPNANISGDGKKSTVLSGSAPPFTGSSVSNNYLSTYQVGASQSAGPVNPSAGYGSAHQPPGPSGRPMGHANLNLGQQGNRTSATLRYVLLNKTNKNYLAPPYPFAHQGPQPSNFPIHGNLNSHWRQMPYGSHATTFQHPQTASDSTASPITPRVVLPPPHGQTGSNSQTPTRPRGRGRGQSTDIPPPPGLVSSSRQIITDPRQNVVNSQTFNNYYLPMQSRNRQYPYQAQQHQMEQQHMGQAQMGQSQMGQAQTINPAYTMVSQKPQPHPDRHARQRILDEQAKSFSQEDDDAFYPHND